MVEFLKHVLGGQNQLASGGLLLMIIGGISVWLRAIPQKIWGWFVAQTTLMITVKDDDAAFVWVKEWFLEQKFLKRIRRVDLDTALRNERVALIPAPGMHWFWYGGRPFQVWFVRSENTRERSARRIESFTFRTVGRKRAVLQTLCERRGCVPCSAAWRAVAPIHLQRRLGFGGRLCAAVAGIGNLAARGEGTSGAGYR